MTPITFKRYNPGGSDPTVIVERITHWEQIDYNGNYGTRIYLDTGKELNVGEWPRDVENKLKAALTTRAQS